MQDTTRPEELWSTFTARTLEAMKHWTEAQQRVLKQAVELSAAATRENARMWAELQAGTIEALREAQGSWLKPPVETADLPKDPMGWYQKALSESTKATHAAFRLMDANVQIVTKGTERLQTAMNSASKEMQETYNTLAAKMQDLYAA
jgi:regulator of sigma D